MKITLADGLPYHPTMRHPHTGNRLRAVFQKSDGSYAWPVIGASEDDDADDTGSDDDTSEEGDDKSEEDKGDKKPDANAERIAKLEADIATMRTHLSNSDKKKAAAEKKIRELEDKDLPAADKLRKEAEEARARGESQSKTIRNLAITNAFLTASQKSSINWFDPEVAQEAAKKYEGIEVSEDGVVTGMDDVVVKLAKEKAFLVNPGKKSDEEDEEDKKNGPSGSTTGTGTKKRQKPGQIDKAELRKKYPALGF